MRNLRLINKYSFISLGISLSLPLWIQPKIIFLFIIILVTISIIQKNRISLKDNALPLLFISLFITGLLSLIYSNNLQFGFNKITTQLSLLILPILVIILGKKHISNYSSDFYRGVIVGNVFLVIYIATGLLLALLLNKSDVVSSNPIRIIDDILLRYNHRTYIGISLVAGYISLSNIYSASKLKYFRAIKVIYAAVLWTLIFLSGSRSILIAYSIILAIQMLTSIDIKRSLIYTTGIIICITVLFSVHPRLSKYISRDSLYTETILKSNVRFELWQASWQLIKNKPLLGYGLGEGNEKLKEATADLETIRYSKQQPNAHNQFIQSWLDTGILGPILILGILLVFILLNKNRPGLIKYGLPLIFLFSMLFEVILYRLSGVLLFTTFLLFPHKKIEVNFRNYKLFGSGVFSSALLLILFGILSQLLVKFNPSKPGSYMPLDHIEIEYNELPGIIPENIPFDAKGCLLNKDSFEKQLQGNLFAQSIINEQYVKSGDSISLSVYCYISKSFNGDQVRISGRGQIQEPNDYYADIDIRDQWQFLNINTTTAKGQALFVLTVGKNQTINSDSIVGEVIFLSPAMRVIKR